MSGLALGAPSPERLHVLGRPAQQPIWRDGANVAAQALLIAGCRFATAYPGSPVTAVAEELDRMDARGRVQFRFGVNEKIAFEMAVAAAFNGEFAACIMKNAGLNVAYDAVAAVVYAGVRGPLLLVIGDDPSCESSATPQDSRHAAKLLRMPCVEPSSLADMVATVRLGRELSLSSGLPVMLRLTTEICQTGEFIQLPDVIDAAALLPAPRPQQFVFTPAQARTEHRTVLAKLEKLANGTHASGDIHVRAGVGERGFVVANSLYPQFQRACQSLGLTLPTFTSALSYPFPTKSVMAFAADYEELVVVEELDAVIEEQLREALAGVTSPVTLRGSREFPRFHALNEARIASVLARIHGLEAPVESPPAVAPRAAALCPGCPHTASFGGLLGVLDNLKPRPFIASDVGCYAMAPKPDFHVADSILCMGSSIAVATGMALRGVPALAVIGDSTFLHAGLPALLNAVEQRIDLTVCILDNSVAGNTGAQPTLVREDSSERLYAVALGLGVSQVVVADPFDTAAFQASLGRLIASSGVSVLIARSPCALRVPAKRRRPVVDTARCNGCAKCVTQINCPAISLGSDGKFLLEPSTCVGCGFCAEICPEQALTPTDY